MVNASLGGESTVGGDVLIWAFSVTAAGSVGGDFEGTQRTLRIEGEVDGDVDVTVNRMLITGPLTVDGDLGYRSPVEAEGIDQATRWRGGGAQDPSASEHQGARPGPPCPVPGCDRPDCRCAARRLGMAGADGARRRPRKGQAPGLLLARRPGDLHAAAHRRCRHSRSRARPGDGQPPTACDLRPLGAADRTIVLVLSLVAGAPAVLALGRLLPGRRGITGRS